MKKLTKTRWIFYGLGIFILTLGISLTILSGLGTSPFDALLVGLSIKVGLTVGSWEIIIAFILIFCNSTLKRNRPEFLGRSEEHTSELQSRGNLVCRLLLEK